MADIYNQFQDFKSFEVIFYNEEKELQKILCTIKSIEKSSIFLSASNNKNKNIFAKVGTDLQLYIYTERGIYSASSKVLLAIPGFLNADYVISYPIDSKHSQRREYLRADIPVNFKILLSTKDETTNSTVIRSITKNISGKGMSYIGDKPFLDYETMNIELDFDDNAVTTKAELVYSQPILVKGVEKYVHAFLFTNISKQNIEFIIKKCFLHQLDLRKKPSSLF